jgi:hypothetical protein
LQIDQENIEETQNPSGEFWAPSISPAVKDAHNPRGVLRTFDFPDDFAIPDL